MAEKVIESVSPSGHTLMYTYFNGDTNAIKLGGVFANGEWQRCCSKDAEGIVTIPQTVTCEGKELEVKGIAYIAFADCKGIEAVVIPNTIEEIEPLAFIRSGITHIEIPKSVRYIGSYAFQRCKRLEHVTFHGRQTKVCDKAFSDWNIIVDSTYSEVVVNEDIDFEKTFYNIRNHQGLWAIVNEEGRILTDFCYDKIGDMFDGYAVVSRNGKQGVINSNGNGVICLDYDEIGFFNAMVSPIIFPVKENDKWGYVKEGGCSVTQMKYDRADPFDCGLAQVYIGGKCGFIDINGYEIIPLIYDKSSGFGCNGLIKAYRNGLPVTLDKDGNIIN